MKNALPPRPAKDCLGGIGRNIDSPCPGVYDRHTRKVPIGHRISTQRTIAVQVKTDPGLASRPNMLRAVLSKVGFELNFVAAGLFIAGVVILAFSMHSAISPG